MPLRTTEGTVVVIPKSVKRLDAYVFWGCNNLEEVVLGKGLTAVDEYRLQDVRV